MPDLESIKPIDFIREAVIEDLKSGRFTTVHTRFPPEPNGYLHIGHAKALIIDFGIAQDFGGLCNLRYDDTNPTKEDVEYVDAIKEDIQWLGFTWDDREYYASDYFDQLYEMAIKLIKKGKAYVDDQSPEEVSATRGTLTEPGVESPYRNRSIEENLDLFERMKNGEFP
ncbi:MAG TPA: glutamate--tRNA ligase family protein, partial [Anaerolineae bacterium]